MLDLWLKILDILDRLMNSGQGDNLEEAVPESLKNILLVMVDGGFLIPPKPEEKPSELWIETCRRVDRFLPGLIADLFPYAVVVPVQSPTRAMLQEAEMAPESESHAASAEKGGAKTAGKAKQPTVETAPEEVD